MNVELPYGEATLTATLPERTRIFSNVEGAVPEPVDDLTAAVGEALAHPRGLPRLGELVRPRSRVAIAFDDATVPSYGPIRTIVIEAVLGELAAAGVTRGQVSLTCANALHRKLRPAELGRIIGAQLVAEFGQRLSCHDAEDPDGLVDLGRTPEHGYPVVVNRCVTESDLLVYVNAGHMRGFNGGWKSVCVGLSTYDSIRVTHTPDGMSMSVHGNRMHAVLDEMGRHLERRLGRPVFKIDARGADAFKVTNVAAGSVAGARGAIVGAMEAMFPPRRDQARARFDVIVYGVPDGSP